MASTTSPFPMYTPTWPMFAIKTHTPGVSGREVIAPRFVHVEQGGSGPELFFSGGQRWRNIVASWYGALSSILSAPRTLDVFVRLSEADLAALDMTRPVYLEQTGQWYIIAKVKTDASTDVCSATLVQVNA